MTFSRFTGWLARQAVSDRLLVKAIRFGLVGVLSGAIFSVVTALFVRLAGTDPKLASVAGYLASMPLNFVGNRRFSFRSAGSLAGDLTRFALLHTFNILLTVLSMGVVVDLLRLHYAVGMVGAIILVPLVNFAAMNWWVFRRRGIQREPSQSVRPK
ncbi:Putative flippase GtrA (transmembrane translocase of bactoprenol-linked glucose) [Bosea sp. OK403]|nr:Putative flippase GtrA (transmembrane translocase of bactoprenol-linked glucose) [Bosea sp. OK403]